MTDTPPPAKKAPRWRRWALEALVLIALVAAFQVWQTRNAPRGPAPHFAGQLVDGRDFDLASWQAQHPGKAGLIYFWAGWCGICKTTAGTVSSLNQDWPVITVAMQSGPADKVAETMRQRGYDWATLPDPMATVFLQYGTRVVPAFIIVDPAGNVRAVTIGYTSEIGLRLRLWWASLSAT